VGDKLYPVYTIEQTTSKRRVNVFKIHVLLLDVCSIVNGVLMSLKVKRILAPDFDPRFFFGGGEE